MKKKKNILLFILLLSGLNFQFAFSQEETAENPKTIKTVVINSPTIETETIYNGDYLYAYPPYPMPAKDKVNSLVYWDKRYDFNKAEINVYNTEGIKICSKERISISQQSDWSSIVTWNASGFPFGIYIILIKHGSKTIAIKVAIG